MTQTFSLKKRPTSLRRRVAAGILDAFDRFSSERSRAERLQRDWRTWCPQEPFETQKVFLGLDCREALFGGAAGGGKSSALLMAALQYVNQPGYAAMILRHEFKELQGPGGLLQRAQEWLIPQGVAYNKTQSLFTFPSGAMLKFGGCASVEDVYKYWGWELHFLGWDEVTRVDKDTYVTSRRLLRKAMGSIIPTRLRAATNPGGKGHLWVKERYISKESIQAVREHRRGVFWIDRNNPEEERAYVPSLLEDNKHVDADDYRLTLKGLDPVTRERLLAGDWSVREDSRIDPAWIRYYRRHSEYYHLLRKDGGQLLVVHPRDCQRFHTVDTAGTSKDKARESKGKPHSWSVISTWDFHRPSGFLIFHKMRRGRWELPELMRQVKAARAEDNAVRTYIENAHFGPGVYQLLAADGQASGVEMMSHNSEDKLTRAVDFLNLCEEGRVYLPDAEPWREDVESEWFAWTGDPDEQADIIDTASYAGRRVREVQPGPPQQLPWKGVA